MKKFLNRIRNFGLYINGRRVKEEGLQVTTNPFSGRVIGRTFLIPQESLIFEEMTPTEETTVPLET
jgi:hypothetical protein